MNRFAFRAMWIAVAVLLVGASVSYGGTLWFWDGGDGTQTTWNYGDENWVTQDSNPPYYYMSAWVDGSDAYFYNTYGTAGYYYGPEGYWVTVTQAINSVNSITFGQDGGYNIATTLNGGNTITMTGPNVTVLAGCPGYIQDPLAGSAGLTKLGAGPLYLQATNTYFGATTISQGTLYLTGSLTHSTPINVANGATFDVSGVGGGYHLASSRTLLGTGTVVGPVTADSGSNVAPGNTLGAVGLLQTTGNVVLNGTYTWDLGDLTAFVPGSDCDGIQMASGNLSGAPTVALNFLDGTAPAAGAFWSADHQWEIINNAGAGTSSFTSVAISGYGVNGVGALGTFSTSIVGNDCVLNWTHAVPEPGTLALLAAGLLGMIAYAWRKRK